MRIAEGMNVAFRPRDLSLRDLENPRLGRYVEITVGARLDFRIPALLDKRRKPANLEVSANQDEDVRLLQPEDEARLRFDEVRILIAFGDRVHHNAIPAN